MGEQSPAWMEEVEVVAVVVEVEGHWTSQSVLQMMTEEEEEEGDRLLLMLMSSEK